MGLTILAACSNCGFKSGALSLGAGMFTFESVLKVPAMNDLGELVSIDLFHGSVHDHTYYHLTGESPNRLRFGDGNLNEDHNACPKCKQQRDEVRHVGLV